LGIYDGELRRAVLRMKHPQHEVQAAALADLLWKECCSELSDFQPDVVVPVPMFWARRLSRGANSPDVIARVLAARLQVPWCGMLSRRRNTAPQASLSPPARFTNVRGAFRFRRDFDCSDARVLLVDDVLTTGATCGEAAKVLMQNGARRVAVAVVARANRPDAS
jgi:ComF family protein